VVLDIEGTVCPLSYVRLELMGWVRTHLPLYLQRTPASPAQSLCQTAWNTPDVLTQALALMDADTKDGPLKALQAEIMQQGW
jgi:methionine salvage enolase-phosphatase E1